MREKEISQFELTIWSLFSSLGIYALFGFITGLFNLELIEANILNPLNLVIIFGLAIIFGFSAGLIVRFSYRRGYYSGDCWEKCMKAAASAGSYVLVYTSDNKEYKGELLFGSISEAQKEIVIKNPKLITREPNLEVKSELELGKNILFIESDIRRIVYLNDIFKD